ncbi:hypothetical protein BpHYR1_048074 [Brachionus plicatilis]|uniref:Uncharacterized protein n=1 Tax=Brachionus plicatilis TaxID=10195 RepID=A0A3M7Q177_BRAPC|nr:hypothetical protein BpHYR1_048074 [Brachionus plicatilis]
MNNQSKTQNVQFCRLPQQFCIKFQIESIDNRSTGASSNLLTNKYKKDSEELISGMSLSEYTFKIERQIIFY